MAKTFYTPARLADMTFHFIKTNGEPKTHQSMLMAMVFYVQEENPDVKEEYKKIFQEVFTQNGYYKDSFIWLFFNGFRFGFPHNIDFDIFSVEVLLPIDEAMWNTFQQEVVSPIKASYENNLLLDLIAKKNLIKNDTTKKPSYPL